MAARPMGGDWHRRLLEPMGRATPERPAVLSNPSITGLQELLRFLHLVRHRFQRWMGG